MDIAFIHEAIDVFSAMTKTWPIVRTQFENRHCDLATDLANLLLIVQFDSTALNGFNDSQGKLAAHLAVLQLTRLLVALRLLVTPTLTSRDWSRAILRSVAPGSLVLRYLVDSSARESFSNEDSGRNREEQPESTPDTAQADDRDVSLPLGLLFNLMDVAEDGGQALLLEIGKWDRSVVRELANIMLAEFSVQCTRAKRCIKQCKCNGREPAVRHLCELFNRQQDKRNDNVSTTMHLPAATDDLVDSLLLRFLRGTLRSFLPSACKGNRVETPFSQMSLAPILSPRSIRCRTACSSLQKSMTRRSLGFSRFCPPKKARLAQKGRTLCRPYKEGWAC